VSKIGTMIVPMYDEDIVKKTLGVLIIAAYIMCVAAVAFALANR